MVRRRLLVIVSAVVMVLIGAGAVGALVAATQSDGGREWIRAQVSRQLNRGLRGRLHLGRLSGTFLTDLTVDSLELRDPSDSVFVASGPITVHYDPRDLIDGRFIFRSVTARHATMVIRKELDETWNFRHVFPVDSGVVRLPIRQPRSAFGTRIVFNDVRLDDAEFRLTKPWHPDDSLSGARRDSAIAAGLADGTNEIRRASLGSRHGFQKTWRWKEINAHITRLRFRDPDSTGRQFDIARLDVDETVPPFRIREMKGQALWRGDTVWLDAKRFALPGSAASATGKIEWPTGDTFWDIRFWSDSTSLADVAWISASIPRVGGGSMRLHVKSRADPDLTDYAITDMDVRTRGTRLRGSMTFGVGGPVLEVRNVNLVLDPADFEFFETLNNAPFPYPWRGTVTGTIRAPGGPVNRFQVASADLAFSDGNVPGATARGTGHGELDILYPGLVKFHGFAVDVDHFDLRTGQFLNAAFPRLNGVVSGTATLDSIWTDVRVRDAEITHVDDDSLEPTRMRGSARVTLGDDFIAFDADAVALPLSMSALARSYPAVPLRGDYVGSLRASGSVADFTLSTDLTGAGGRIQLDGRFDAFSPGYAATARGSVSRFDLRRAFGNERAPPTALDARFAIDVRGDSLANAAGTARLDVDRSMVDSVRVFGGAAVVGLGDGLLRVDSLHMESVAGVVRARGALGTVPSTTDSLRFEYAGDSLGGLRRYLSRTGVGDSLQGVVRATGVLTGRVTHFALDAAMAGTGLLLRTTEARELRGTIALSALPDSATGSVTMRLDGVRSGSLAISEGDLRADLLGGWQARVSGRLAAPSGAGARLVADVRRRADTTLVRFDSLRAGTASNTWLLRRPGTLSFSSAGFGLDTVELAGDRGGRIVAAGRTTAGDTVAVALRADAVPLADLGDLLQSRDSMAGTATLRADLRGTRARPDLFFSGVLDGARVAGMSLDRLDADGRYADRRLTASVALSRGGVAALHADASLPLDLAFEPTGSRFLEEPLSARVRTDSAGLGLLEAFLPSVTRAQGRLRVDVDASGTWRHPRLDGSISVTDGTLSFRPMGAVNLQGVVADIGLLGDSIAIRRVAARSGPGRATAELSGGIGIGDPENPTFNLRLDTQSFTAIQDPRLADLDLTGSLRLDGTRSAAVLTGGFTVDRGVIRLPELTQKRIISLDDPNLFRVVDTTALANRRLLTAGDSLFMNNLAVRNVRIGMGPDVWLRSDEANINLGGSVAVTRMRVLTGPGAGRWQLALEGPLQTVRGTYRLNLGPVQRTFAVEDGDVRFYGDPDFNASLNINALYTVRQVSQQGARPDVRVMVHIGGTRLSPTAELSSPDSARVTRADLVSYLATGGPGTAISGPSMDYGSAAYRFALSTVGTYLGGKASGGICDDVQISTASLDAFGGPLRAVGGRTLQATRLNCAKQVTDRVFVRLDAGLCQVGRLVDPGTAVSSPTNFTDMFGVKLDYRVSPDVTISGGVEPPTSAVYCRDDASARGFAPTPKQFGLDLVKLWRF